MPDTTLEAGRQLHGFEVTDSIDLPELNAVMYRCHHLKTGARLIHLATEDPNNLFAVTFRTPPNDSTGVAHILEHTVLCGSKRFPVRDPFFTMLKRSLNTFMNALTSSDWTMYPFSSQNTKDFYNLMDIYLDAAFFPLLRERDFRQEGHRLEFADPTDPASPLQFKGVVYNEMKGAMASPPSLLGRRLGRALYPTTCYHHNSGGEPEDIPDLSWEELRAFHARYYHPSNAYFFTYGNLSPEKHLETIEKQVLRHFSAQPVASEVPPEKRFTTPKLIEEVYPVDETAPLERQTLVQTAWLTCDIADSYDRLALTLLSSLLLGNPAAPLYKALLDSGLGSNLAPGCGFQDENRTTYFAAGLQGCDAADIRRIEGLVLKTLEDVAGTGFSAERIEGAIHRLEFGHREVSGDHFPYPLNLLFRILGPWLHCDDPVSPLKLDENLARLRRDLASGPFLQDLIRRYFLDNPHRVTLGLRPDPEQRLREEAEVSARLEKIAQSLTAADRERLVVEARKLQDSQEAEEDLSCLPSLSRQDIPATEQAVPAAAAPENGHEVVWCDQPTNGIGYFTAHLPTDCLTAELLPLLPIFCTLLTQVGAAGHSYLAMAERMEAGTGGILAGTLILESPQTLRDFTGGIELKGKALVRNQDKLFGILLDFCRAPDFTDLGRLQTVIGQMKTALENSIPSSGHSYAARAGAGHLSAAAAQRESWAGLSLIRLVRELAARRPEELAGFAEQLQAIAGTLFDSRRIACAVTSEERHFPQAQGALGSFLNELPKTATGTPENRQPFTATGGRFGWATSVPVSYVTRVFSTVPYTHADAAPLTVLSKLLRASYLHREIREKGGAYGGMASYDSEGGLFSLLSYRDPHLARTLRVYDDAIAWAAGGRFDDQAIDEAILAVFSELDRPLSPGGRGHREFANRRQGLS
ncbi:MAG TPA: insulinase family protein, partial [Desulfuromonadales bacterium]|nr:insulinase family protein [Desulfuromonadales bacterium]